MSASRTLAPLALALLACGCTLGPDYERPELAMPEGWRQVEAEEQDSLANTPWWELFDDPALVSLIEIALEENRDLAIAVERIEETRARYGFQRSELYPQVDGFAGVAGLQFSRTGVPTLPPVIDNQGSFHTLGASVFWELDAFGRIRRASEAELAQLYAAEQTRRAVVLSVVSEVARAYVELRDFDQRLAIARRTLESRERYVVLARDRFEGDLTSELDLLRAEAELHRTAVLVHEFEQRVAQKENEIASLLGRTPGAIERGRPLDELRVPESAPAGLPSELLDRRPDVRAAEEQLASSTARIGEAKALLYPSISITGAFGWESQELSDLLDSPAQSWSIGANLLQPIFNGGRNRSRVEVAESLQRQALYAYENTVLQALREVEDSLVGLRQSGLRREELSLRVASEDRVLALADVRYSGGVSDYLEVLDAQRSLLDAELRYSASTRDELVELIRLYKALGGGWLPEPEPEEEAAEQQPQGAP